MKYSVVKTNEEIMKEGRRVGNMTEHIHHKQSRKEGRKALGRKTGRQRRRDPLHNVTLKEVLRSIFHINYRQSTSSRLGVLIILYHPLPLRLPRLFYRV